MQTNYKCRLITESPLNVVVSVRKKSDSEGKKKKKVSFFKEINNGETDRVMERDASGA